MNVSDTSGFSNARTVIVDKTRPTAKKITPANSTAGVAPTTNVMATSSEAMNKSTVNKLTFFLVKKGTTIKVPAKVTYDAKKKRAILNPGIDLVPRATYIATGTTGAKDLAGNTLVAKKVWQFTVR